MQGNMVGKSIKTNLVDTFVRLLGIKSKQIDGQFQSFLNLRLNLSNRDFLAQFVEELF